MWTIRSYLNTDTPALSKIWALHCQSFHPNPTTQPAHNHPGNSLYPPPQRDSHCRDLQLRSLECKPAVWDACIFSKPYFNADELLLAIDENGESLGFIHFGVVPVRTNQERSSIGCIHRLCVNPSPIEADIASDLIKQALEGLRAQGAKACQSLGCGEDSTFYLGIAEGDNSMGILGQDQRSQDWFHRAGFAPVCPTECWELELASFRPPMDRMQIQVRRNCTIGRMLEEDYDDWLESTILGHCEQLRFHLMVKSPPALAGILSCWFPDPEVADVDGGIVRIKLPEIPMSEIDQERFVYLLSESLRQLQQDRKRIVRVVASAQKQQTITLLQRLGFRSMMNGLIFEKQLS
ncbi:MAG: hypothetical protein ACK5PB_07915 [Pirellula sp.]